jgi:formylglycine-generating enzyme required for sulfatase activity
MRTACLARGVAVAAGLLVPLAAAPPAFANSAPVVTNVQAAQIAGTGQVRITYDVSDADGDQVTARVMCSLDNGAHFDVLPVSVSGDVYVVMAPGPGKTILWNAAADYPGRYWSQVVAQVWVSDGPALAGEMVPVPAGNFTMGQAGITSCELPVHVVYLDAFYMDKFEVTNAEFKQFMDAGGYDTQGLWSVEGWAAKQSNGWTQPAYWGNDAYHSGPAWPGFPVIGVSWFEAEAYANFAGKRLPTEAEWEKAARGTDQRTYPWGNSIDGSRANYGGSGDPYDGTTPVGFYDGRLNPNPPFQTTDSPSPYGAYDMAGNVSEWVKDWFECSYYSSSPALNPQGPSTGYYRVMRSGSWNDAPGYLGSAYRCDHNYYVPWSRDPIIGFRCARTSP